MPARTPCANCPWRVGVVGARDIPGWGPELAAGLARSCRDDGMKAMACHKSKPGAEVVCAGFVVQVGFDSIGLRILAVMHGLRVEDYAAGDAALHPDFETMLQAHGIEVPPRNRFRD